MARISNIAIKQEPGHFTLTIRKTIDFMKEYADFAQQAWARTGDCLKECGLFPISGPIACFHNMELASLDVELGWQIAREVAGKEGMTCRYIPSRKVVTAIDMGPYEEQDPTLEDIFRWIKENRYEPQGAIQYCYLNDTQRPPAQFLTQMSLPVR